MVTREELRAALNDDMVQHGAGQWQRARVAHHEHMEPRELVQATDVDPAFTRCLLLWLMMRSLVQGLIRAVARSYGPTARQTMTARLLRRIVHSSWHRTTCVLCWPKSASRRAVPPSKGSTGTPVAST